MQRILIAYATHFGQTRKIADTIAGHLRERGLAVELADVSNMHRPSPADYDLVILGSRIELGHHASSMVTYVRDNIDVLRTKPTAFFVVCNAAAHRDAGPDPSGYATAFFDEVGWHPAMHASFGGALRYRSYNFFLRFVMKRIAKSAGHPTDTSRDHELTDWVQVAQFADQLAQLIRQSQDQRSQDRPTQTAS